MKNLRKLVVALSLISAGGCATTPFPAWENPGQGGQTTARAGLDDALALLQRDREAVSKKLRELADTERQAGNFMLGSGILALIGAVSGGHRDTILAPAMLGGSVYTFSRYHDRAVPSLIYKQALLAYDCIEVSVVPYRLGEAHSDLIKRTVANDDTRKALLTAIGDTAGARAELAAHEPGNPLLAQAETLIQQGRATLEHLDAARKDVHDLYARTNRLPGMIVERLASIRTVTDSALSDGQPKLDSIPALIADLPRTVASLQPQAKYGDILGLRVTRAETPATPKAYEGEPPKAPPSNLVTPLRAVMNELANATHAADSNTRELAAVLAAVASRDDYNRLKSCGIDAQALQAQMALTLEPAELDFPAGKKGQTDIEIKGGTPPYVVDTYQPDQGSLTVGPSPNNGLFTIATDDKVKAQELEIRVMDSAGHTRKLKLHVK